MPRVYAYHVTPCLPPRLHCLNKLSLNLRWSWHHPTIELFRALDRDLWEETRHNPWLLLGRIEQKRLVELSADEAFLAQWDALEGPRPEPECGPIGWRGHSAGIRRQYFNA